MRVRLTTELSFEAGPTRQVGEIVDLPAAQAEALLRIGLVEAVADADAAPIEAPIEAAALDDTAAEQAVEPRARKRG